MRKTTIAALAAVSVIALSACKQTTTAENAATSENATASATAAGTGIDGTWKADIDSVQIDQKPDELLLQAGQYSCKSCVPSYTVAADGAFHDVKLPYADSISVKVDDDHNITRTSKKGGRQVGETKVSISYVPIAGFPADYGDSYEVGERADAACVDAALRASIAKRKAKGGYYEVATVGYVLTTAKYWKGPIRSFNLSVEKPDEKTLAAFCPAQAKKVSPTRFEWHAKDFAPAADLSVIFYTFQETE